MTGIAIGIIACICFFFSGYLIAYRRGFFHGVERLRDEFIIGINELDKKKKTEAEASAELDNKPQDKDEIK